MNEMLYAGSALRIGALMLLGIPAIKWVSNLCALLCKKRFSQHVGILIGHIVLYSGLVFIGVTILHEFGFNVSALLGAAGVFGVAIGFASQTSISNIISGFFLLAERPFSIGDTIKSGDIVGSVESIDLLSVRVQTVDNKLVRLPNEMVLKNSLTNFTFYSIRRVDCVVSVAYSDKIELIVDEILGVIKNNSMFLVHPNPAVTISKIAQHEFSAEIRVFLAVRVWVDKDQFNSASGVLMQQLKKQFDQRGVVITAIQVN